MLRRAQVLEGQDRCFHAAVERDLAEESRGGDLVAREQDSVAAVDGGPVAPGRARPVDGAGSARRECFPAPGGAFAPAGEAEVQQVLGSAQGVGARGAGCEGDLGLEELFARRGEGGVLGGEPFDPAGGVEVGDDERVAAPGPQGQVEQGGPAAVPGQGGVLQEGSGGVQMDGDDDGAASPEFRQFPGPMRASVRMRTPRSQARAAIRSTSRAQPPTG